MNTPVATSAIEPNRLTTTPLPGSRKIHLASDYAGDVRVPFREIRLSDPEVAAFRVYDTSGPNSDPEERWLGFSG